ncbi:MAG: hypothetical protein QW702_08750 [Candidatus Bathyarchaeia archaeon]
MDLEEIREKLGEIDFSGKLKYLLIASILIGVLAGSAYASYTSVKVFKPALFGLEFADLPITIENVRFNYNAETNRYAETIITLRNLANQNFDNIKVSVVLLNATLKAIANGEIVTSISANQVKQVSISLVWVNQNTIANCSSGKITISP